jgi:YidC/Oxa1 family membrane protein insertase
MGLTMWLQMRLNPQPPDPVQAKIFAFMPIIFTFLLAQFPAGLVIYWTWNNLLSIGQQVVIMKRAGVPIGRQPKTTSE